MHFDQKKKLLIGLDLDNTIIDYSSVFAPIAKKIGLLPDEINVQSKTDVKDWLRANAGEEAWMRLQGQVYGRYILRANAYVGCKNFIETAKEKKAEVVIVSHKTRHGHFDDAKIDLHEAALGWLKENGFLSLSGLNLQQEDVHFRETREEKVKLIEQLGCDVFIDDLPEVLMDGQFPAKTQRLWFVNGRKPQQDCPLEPYRNWSEMLDIVKGLL